MRHLEESASVMQGPLVASVINLWQVRKQLASPYLLHLHELFKVVKVFKAAGVFKVVKFVLAVKMLKVVKMLKAFDILNVCSV